MKRALVLCFCFLFGFDAMAQNAKGLWHGVEREIHYKPDGEDFLLVNGKRRFNRALYGGNSAFRAEAGDLPEFALYLPGMGGNLKFGLIKGSKSKWLIDAQKIETRYRPGSMLYTIRDSFLGEGYIDLTAIATYDREGLVIKMESNRVPADVQLVVVYGGATGTKFSRDGDIGADPESSFYLKPEYCRNNIYKLHKNEFSLFFGAKSLSDAERYEMQYGDKKDTAKLPSTVKQIQGVFPGGSNLQLGSASMQDTPLLLISSKDSLQPVLLAQLNFSSVPRYFYLGNGAADQTITEQQLPILFARAESTRRNLAGRIRITTPDPFINTLGGAISIAADAVWDNPSYLHGAVAWRMRLPGWRGAYLADVLGWHDRARAHFNAYALSQVTEPAAGPIVMDTALHLARHAEKMGTSVFSSGYISRNPGGDKRPHHYDMNLVFIDQLMNHFLWTGDTAYVKTMWPLLERHLAWEDRNFDVDGDNLYDAYAAIWASDALQYSGGGVTHSSAYNYKAYQLASELAALAGEDGEPYRRKAAAILKAINTKLWMPEKGVYAEYKDLLGKQLLHPSPGIWTIYHAIDSKVPNAFQAYQSLQYINNHIPRIPIRAKGLSDTTLYTISTTNWQPYTWSLNNVSLGEVMHTALAYWQGGRSEDAFRLFKGSLVESMYLGASPGNFQQLSFYDAMRGELYRDFADDIGTTARSVVEGLFGVFVDALRDTVHITPGFPAGWKHASLSTPDFNYVYKQTGTTDQFTIALQQSKKLVLSMLVNARMDNVESVIVNGKQAAWFFDSNAVEIPRIQITAAADLQYQIEIKWKGKPIHFSLDKIGSRKGRVLSFAKVRQGKAVYWQPQMEINGQVLKLPEKKINVVGVHEKIDLTRHFNDEVTNIFKNQYVSPRPKVPTLQLPTRGIGNWAYPLVMPNINDSGLRHRAGIKNEIITKHGIPFTTPSHHGAKNIVFTSQWDNYPDSVSIPLAGRASHAFLLMAGSTNPMQSQMVNGEVVVQYKDGTEEKLELRNPENWWPIEQDYYNDGFAFNTKAPVPVRVHLKSGEEARDFRNYTSIKGFTSRAIEGGAATVLEMPLDPSKEIQSLTLKAIANDVVIGLMSLTLVRPN